MKLSLINPLFFRHERVVGFLLPTNGDLDGREAVQLHCNENARTECSQRQEDTDFALPMLAVSTKGGFCHASLQVEGKEVLPFTFSSQSTGTSLWFHWMWLNAQTSTNWSQCWNVSTVGHESFCRIPGLQEPRLTK
jgi:hypothetical protein